MKNVLFSITLMLISGCSMMPQKTKVLNDPQTLARADLNSNGVLAYVPEYIMNENADMYMDLNNIDSNKIYRISLTPPLKTYSSVSVLGNEVYKGEVKKSEVSDTVALILLPPGKYVTKYAYAYFGDRKSVKGSVTENVFTITSNEVTSFGRTQIPFKAGLFTATIPTMTTIDTNTTTLIKKCSMPISNMKISHVSVNINSK